MLTAEQLKEQILRTNPKTHKTLRNGLIAKYKQLTGNDFDDATEPAPPAAAAVTTKTEPAKPTQTSKAATLKSEEEVAVEVTSSQTPHKAVASAGGIAYTTPQATATASTTHSKPYELSEPVKQIIKEFEETGDDGGYPPSDYYMVTEEVLKRYCRDNGIDYDELMKNNRVAKTQSFLT